MNSTDYKDAWQAFEENPDGDYSSAEIESIIGLQSKKTADSLQRYLQFDLLTKIATLIVLLWVIYLFRNSTYLLPLSLSALVGAFVGIRQMLLIIRLKRTIDYSNPVKEVIGDVFKQIKSNLTVAGLLVAITNPLLILTGSFLYYYNKYGPSYSQDEQDLVVTTIILLVGFVFGYATFSVQHNSQLNDLETSLAVLNGESEYTIAVIASRRRRRMIIVIALLVLGVALFLILLTSFLFRY